MNNNEKNSGIGYSGKIKVSVLANNKVIKTKEYKNNGSVKLFEFLAQCLTGKYNTAQANQPKLVQGFLYPTDGQHDADEIINATCNPFRVGAVGDVGIATSRLLISDGIKATSFTGKRENPGSPSEISTTGVVADNAKIYYYFRIPATQIFRDINMFCLYSGINNAQEDFSACFLLTKNNNSEWDPIKIDSVTDNYTLLLEWEMTLKNTNS